MSTETKTSKRSEIARQRRAEIKLHPIKKFEAVASAIRRLRNRYNPERLIKVLGPTGAGKTTLRDFLVENLSDTLDVATVECRDTWRPATRDLRARCKLVVLLDIFSAFDLKPEVTPTLARIPELEDQLIEFLADKARVLFMDEAEFFSAYALNLVKLLLNQTRLIVVVACTPHAHAKWQQWYPDEANQIARRTDAVVTLGVVSPEDVGLFFGATALEPRETLLAKIAEEASRFGHLSFVARVVKLLGDANGVTEKQLETHMDKALRQMGKSRMTAIKTANA